MAKLRIGLGALISPEDREALQKEADAMPDEWLVELSGDPTTAVSLMKIVGPGFRTSQSIQARVRSTGVKFMQHVVREHTKLGKP